MSVALVKLHPNGEEFNLFVCLFVCWGGGVCRRLQCASRCYFLYSDTLF